MPLITVVIPTLNAAKYLSHALASLRHQEYNDLEVIVVDGGSTDGTMDIVEQYKDVVTRCVSEEDSGQSHAIVKGMGMANGELCNWLNADDMYIGGALRMLAEVYRKRKNSRHIIACDGYYLQGGSMRRTSVGKNNAPLYPNMLPWIGGLQASWFYSRAVWDAVGGIDVERNYTMDTEYYQRCYEVGAEIAVVNTPVAIYRIHGDTKTIGGWKESVQTKRAYYRQKLGTYDGCDRRVYVWRQRRWMYGLCVNSILPSDPVIKRIEKMVHALYYDPYALVRRHKMIRLCKRVMATEDEH